MNLKLKRTPGIFLAGFMGSGKTTVGRLLAERLGWNFVDLDAEIEAAEGMPIEEIFATRGEAEFRRVETEVLRRHVASVACGRPEVVALGGGAFCVPGNRDLVGCAGVTVWLDCPLDVVTERVAGEPGRRPNARDPRKFAELFRSRRDLYARAGSRVDASGSPASVVEAILELKELQ